jgi:probable HAF family extracellular repeat protein
MALWAAALLLSTVALFAGSGARQASAADPAAYTVEAVGDLNMASGINNDGQIVGDGYTARGTQHAFLYHNGSTQDLGTLTNDHSGWHSDTSYGRGINNNGQVVGQAFTPDDAIHGFLWENGAMQDLGALRVPWERSVANEINDHGQVVGESLDPYSRHAFLWENGSMQDLGTFGGDMSSASSINNHGQIVGYAGVMFDQRAFLYHNGSKQDLGTMGGTQSFAFDINDQGQVVGVADTASGNWHPFLYENGSMKDLGTLGGQSSQNQAKSINDPGQVVGGSFTAEGERHAFIYQDGTMRDLNSLIPQDSGWVLREATDNNDGGQIVGWGFLNGQQSAFLLTPTTPPSVDSASESVAAGGLVATSTGDGTASASDPVNTSVTTPVAGTVSINETSVSQPETTGFSFFGQQVNIEAPQASVQNPLSLRFVIDSSLLSSAGVNANSLQLFRNGVRIEPCDSGTSSTAASPDPCIKQRSQLADGDASITILSSHASAWNLGVAKAGTPLYSFKGFFQPVDKLPTINSVKAGAAVPVRFSLGGDKGLEIFMAGYPLSGRTPSDPNASLDQIEQTVTASSSGLSYSAGSGQYTYTWKTDKAWAGQTRQLVMRLKDGTEHKAGFKFTK